MNFSPPGSPTSVTYSSVAGAITGLVLWALSTYVFRGQVLPAPIEAAAWILIPCVVNGMASWYTRRSARQEATPAPVVKE